MGKRVVMPEKTKARYGKISEGLAKLGFKEGKDFRIFNATGNFLLTFTPSAVERLTGLMEAGIAAIISEMATPSNPEEKIREDFLNRKGY
jgi:hypothetical protein